MLTSEQAALSEMGGRVAPRDRTEEAEAVDEAVKASANEEADGGSGSSDSEKELQSRIVDKVTYSVQAQLGAVTERLKMLARSGSSKSVTATGAAEIKDVEAAVTSASPFLFYGERGRAGVASPKLQKKNFGSKPRTRGGHRQQANLARSPADVILQSSKPMESDEDDVGVLWKRALGLRPKGARVVFPPKEKRTLALIEMENVPTWPDSWVSGTRPKKEHTENYRPPIQNFPVKADRAVSRSFSHHELVRGVQGTGGGFDVEPAVKNNSVTTSSTGSRPLSAAAAAWKAKVRQEALIRRGNVTGMERYQEVARDWAESLRTPADRSKSPESTASTGGTGRKERSRSSRPRSTSVRESQSVEVDVARAVGLGEADAAPAQEQLQPPLFYTEDSTGEHDVAGKDSIADVVFAESDRDNELAEADEVQQHPFADPVSRKLEQKALDPTERGNPKARFATSQEVAYRDVRSGLNFDKIFAELTGVVPQSLSPHRRGVYTAQNFFDTAETADFLRGDNVRDLIFRDDNYYPFAGPPPPNYASGQYPKTNVSETARPTLWDSGDTNYSARLRKLAKGEQTGSFAPQMVRTKPYREFKIGHGGMLLEDGDGFVKSSRFQGKVYGARKGEPESRSRSRSRSRSSSPAKMRRSQSAGKVPYALTSLQEARSRRKSGLRQSGSRIAFYYPEAPLEGPANVAITPVVLSKDVNVDGVTSVHPIPSSQDEEDHTLLREDDLASAKVALQQVVPGKNLPAKIDLLTSLGERIENALNGTTSSAKKATATTKMPATPSSSSSGRGYYSSARQNAPASAGGGPSSRGGNSNSNSSYRAGPSSYSLSHQQPSSAGGGKVTVDASVLKTIRTEVANLQDSLARTRAEVPALQSRLLEEQAKVERLSRATAGAAKVRDLENRLRDRDAEIRQLRAAQADLPVGPELQELYQELKAAKEVNRRLMEDKAVQQEEKEGFAERVGDLKLVIEEQKARLQKFDDLQRKWTQAARLDEQKMRDLHKRIEEY
eukprot:g5512.t1